MNKPRVEGVAHAFAFEGEIKHGAGRRTVVVYVRPEVVEALARISVFPCCRDERGGVLCGHVAWHYRGGAPNAPSKEPCGSTRVERLPAPPEPEIDNIIALDERCDLADKRHDDLIARVQDLERRVARAEGDTEGLDRRVGNVEDDVRRTR